MDKWMEAFFELSPGNANSGTYILPGSHDSCAYTVDMSIPISEKTFEQLRKIPYPLNFPVVDWVKTQNLNIYEQLRTGIRYLDIRVSVLNKKVYASHTYACVELETVLDHIFYFAKNNRKEIIVVDITKDFENPMSSAQADLVYETIMAHIINNMRYNSDEVTKQKAFPEFVGAFNAYSASSAELQANKNVILPTPRTLFALRTPILMFIDTKKIVPTEEYANFSRTFPSPLLIFKKWANAQTEAENTSHYKKLISNNTFPSSNTINILEETLTPDKKDVTKSITYYGSLCATLILSGLILAALQSRGKSIVVIVITILAIVGILTFGDGFFKSVYGMTSVVRTTIVDLANKSYNFDGRVTVITGDFVSASFVNYVLKLYKRWTG